MDPTREPLSGSPSPFLVPPAVSPAPSYLSGEPQPSPSWSYHTATAYYHQPPDQSYPAEPPYHPPPAFSPGPMGSWMSTALSVQQQYATQDLDDAASYPAMTEDTQDSLPPAGGDEIEPEGEATLSEKPLADLACQRFRRVKKAADVEKGQRKAKLVRRGRGNAARWGDVEKAEEEDVGSVASEVRGVSEATEASEELENAVGAAVDSAAAEEEPEETEPVDETEEAEAEEFFSQLIDLGEDEEDGENRAVTAKPLVARRGNLRWSEDECELLRSCCRLLESDYCMIQEFLPHRSIAEIKKQYDRQRALYPNLLAHWAMSPRYHSVQEYYNKKAELEREKAAFEKEMAERGVRPWADGLEGDVKGPRGRKRKTD